MIFDARGVSCTPKIEQRAGLKLYFAQPGVKSHAKRIAELKVPILSIGEHGSVGIEHAHTIRWDEVR